MDTGYTVSGMLGKGVEAVRDVLIAQAENRGDKPASNVAPAFSEPIGVGGGFSVPPVVLIALAGLGLFLIIKKGR